MDLVSVYNSLDAFQRCICAGIPLLLVVIVLGGFCLISVILCIISSVIGFLLAIYVWNYSNGEFLWNFLEYIIGEKLVSEISSPPPLSNSSRNEPRRMPWEGLFVPESVNRSLEELIEQLIDNYINSWYESEISHDVAFISEIRYQIRFASSVLLHHIQNIDLSSFILFDAIPVAVIHGERVARLSAEIDKQIFPPQMIETKILECFPDVHYAMGSRLNEINYLRHIADYILTQIIDETRVAGHASDDDSPFLDSQSAKNRVWPSQVCRHFLRELIVFSFLIPVLDLIADPDTINHLLILLFDPEPVSKTMSGSKPQLVPFLHGLTECTQTGASDSLLLLKLSDILRDQRQLQMFTMYLKDIRGPTNELCFLQCSGDIHERILNRALSDENAVSELQFDVWDVFTKYVHNNAPEKVLMPDELENEFRHAVESKKIEELDRAIEKTYQFVYKRMQHDYVVPFCQSECYFGHLCGSPPFSVEELRFADDDADGRPFVLSAVDAPFSFSQFRNRFWKVIMPSATEGSDIGAEESVEYSTPCASVQSSIDIASDTVLVDDIPDLSRLDTPDNSSDQNSGSCDTNDYIFIDDKRDINRWMVTIPRIEPRRDPTNGHTMYVYIVCVERFDLSDTIEYEESSTNSNGNGIRKWSIIRKYNEFYVLESKLLEFHGENIKTEPLPPRRSFSVKSRAFIASQREILERFLQLMTREEVLKGSDLLFAFLTSEKEFRDNVQFSDLNPWNMVRKMPVKFSRERGQNLKPFLLSLLAVALAPTAENSNSYTRCLRGHERSESSSMSSFNIEFPNKPNRLVISTIYGNNCPTAHCDISANKLHEPWSKSLVDSLIFLLDRFFTIPRLISSTVRFLSQLSIDAAVAALLRYYLHAVLSETNIVRMVRLMQDALFSAEEKHSTEQEKTLRAELAQRRTLEFLQEELPNHLINVVGQKRFRAGIQALFNTLQYPRLNKQLSYVLLDIIIQKVFTFPSE
ncbi:hypothetical protein AB6A40_000415 [Gnathostoma spinigerum]|uniref:Sorting nexin-14 n=1 Tax=Gnathostoma spinigerum TaxID=75299 RepID=A0ABD6E8M8_9BILA